jgi:hypothetical protein
MAAGRTLSVDIFHHGRGAVAGPDSEDHFFDREPRCGEAVAHAMAFFMSRYTSAAMTSA